MCEEKAFNPICFCDRLSFDNELELSAFARPDIHAVLFKSNLLNPALAGSSGCPRFAMNYRNEWPQLTGNYVTYSAAFDTYAKSISGGIGILAMHDQQGQGTISTSMLGAIYSYNLKVNRKFSLMFGARAAWFQKFLDWDKLTFGDMIDPRRGFIYQTGDVPRGNGRRGYFDASAGFVGFGKNFYFGGAVHHLNQPDESMILGESKLPMRFTGHAGADIPLGRKGRYSSTTSIMPNIIYQYQNGFQELNIGTYVKVWKLYCWCLVQKPRCLHFVLWNNN